MFYYTQIRANAVPRSRPGRDDEIWSNVMRADAIASHLPRNGVIGATAPVASQDGKRAMGPRRHVQIAGPIRNFTRCRLYALACLAAAIVMTAHFTDLALAQGSAARAALAAPASVAAPAAPAPTVAPSAASPASATPAANAAAPTPRFPSAEASSPPAAAAPPIEPSISGELLPQKLSLVRMYLDADRVVKAVMIGLAFASVLAWTVFVAKTLELRKARNEVRRGLRVLVDATTFVQAYDQLRDAATAVGQFMRAAGHEIRLSANASDGLTERVTLQLERLELAASRKISRGTGVLATIGSTGVFVGLFGTVWGIMNSFIGISNAHATNLAVVAPGIAQALLATAMGLIAAIPAVVIYNALTRQTAHYRALLGDASAQIVRLVSRDLDRAKLPLVQAAE